MLSLETCLKLQEAGFKQPISIADHIGRFVYIENESGGIRIEWRDALNKEGYRLLAYDYPLEELLEAVREIPTEEVVILYCSNNDESGKREYDAETRSPDHSTWIYDADDPSEAVAALWLKLKGVK